MFSSRELEVRGVSQRDRGELVRQGRLRPVARGWFASQEADQAAVTAIRSGVRLTCTSAARLNELWTPPESGVHVYGRRGKVPPGFVAHGPYTDGWPESEPVASLELCLQHAARCLSSEYAAILFESALTQRLLTQAEVDGLTRSLPLRVRTGLRQLTGLSESGSETRVAQWLRSRGIGHAQQVQIPGVGRVDFLVGRSWIIEVDSRAHHTATPDYERDRARDLAARIRGYTVTRLSFTQVWDSWQATQLDLGALVATRRHRRPPRPAN